MQGQEEKAATTKEEERRSGEKLLSRNERAIDCTEERKQELPTVTWSTRKSSTAEMSNNRAPSFTSCCVSARVTVRAVEDQQRRRIIGLDSDSSSSTRAEYVVLFAHRC